MSTSTDTLEIYACSEPGDQAGTRRDSGADDANDAAGPDGGGARDAAGGDVDAGGGKASDAGGTGDRDGTGDAGDAGGDSGGSGGAGNRTIADRCADSTEVYCNNGYDCAQLGWGVDASDFEQLYGQSLEACLAFGTPCTTEEAYCSDRGLPGSYVPANHEACIDGQQSSSCEVDDFGLPVYPAVCDQICVE